MKQSRLIAPITLPHALAANNNLRPPPEVGMATQDEPSPGVAGLVCRLSALEDAASVDSSAAIIEHCAHLRRSRSIFQSSARSWSARRCGA